MKLLRILLLTGAAYSLTFSKCQCGDLTPETVVEYPCFLRNNSNDTLNWSFSISWPDTTIENNLDTTPIYPLQLSQIYLPVNFLPDFKTTGVWEIFLYNVDTLRKYGWPTVASNYLIAKRFDLTYDSLQADSNIITYP